LKQVIPKEINTFKRIHHIQVPCLYSRKTNKNEIKKKQEKVNVFSRLNEEIEEICPRSIDLPLHCDISKTCSLLEPNCQKDRQREVL